MLTRAAAVIEVRDISGDAVAALGWLLAELGEFAAVAHRLAAAYRRHTADYAPKTTNIIRNARP